MLINTIRRRLTHSLSRIYDPLVKLHIGTQTIKVNLSHQLREIIKVYPNYNFNLARLVKYTEKKLGKVSIIDIGANVGDTVAYIRNSSAAPILCIDGEPRYVQILRNNVKQYANVSICESLVGKENSEEKIKLKAQKGTAEVVESNRTIAVRTLENILQEYPEFNRSKILKSDTDGFDTLILRSCSNYLKTIKPILFFEFDPYLIKKNGDDPFAFIKYLENIGYKYVIFYTNVGDLLLGCSVNDSNIINQLIHFFSGRNVEIFADICAFTEEDKEVYDYSILNEIEYFKNFRSY